MTESRYIEPVDVLFVRGNRLFGDPGSYGEALMPPWPSLAAGALRSRMLVDHGVDPARYANGQVVLAGDLATCLGTVEQPGTFRVGLFALARRAGTEVEPLLPAPADLIIHGESVDALDPAAFPASIRTSLPVPWAPVLRASFPGKPDDRQWLGRDALAAYLAGSRIPRGHLLARGDIWNTDLRLGMALDEPRRTALEGHLYTADAVAFHPGFGFVAGVEGADGLVPRHGVLRFGGDGRAAQIEDCALRLPDPAWSEIERDRRFRLVLASPGIFPEGWLPTGMTEPMEKGLWELFGVRARLVSACVPRSEVISGWDLARGLPKPAVRAAPVGSVYWFDALEGSIAGLRRVAQEGLWEPGRLDAARRAEGFNTVLVAAWPRRL